MGCCQKQHMMLVAVFLLVQQIYVPASAFASTHGPAATSIHSRLASASSPTLTTRGAVTDTRLNLFFGSRGGGNDGAIRKNAKPLLQSSSSVSNSSFASGGGFLNTLWRSWQKIAVAAGATVLTYALHNDMVDVSTRRFVGEPVLASGAVSLAAALLLPGMPAAAAMCGTFAGMATPVVIPTVMASLVLGVTCGAMLVLFDQTGWLMGKGGRSGFVAQLACTLQFLLTRALQNRYYLATATAPLYNGNIYRAMTWSNIIKDRAPNIIVWTTVGALFTQLWQSLIMKLGTRSAAGEELSFFKKFALRLASPTAAVGVAGILATLIPQVATGSAYCGSFLATSAPMALPDWGALVAASVWASVAQIALMGVFLGGWGGKLGTAALLGVVLHRVFLYLTSFMHT